MVERLDIGGWGKKGMGRRQALRSTYTQKEREGLYNERSTVFFSG